MSSAAAEMSVSPEVSLQMIEEAKGVNKLSQLAVLFTPPVSTENCQNVDEKRERLRCAFRKTQGQAMTLEAFGETMEQLKASDTVMRSALTGLFESARQAVTDCVELDGMIGQQLQKEVETQDYERKIGQYLKLLKQPHCPVVMAGQVSSGKSTLLNLFLGREVLPHQLLSCTATICELTYADTDKAELLLHDGCLREVPFADRDNYIYKPSERDKRFEYDAIRLHLKVPFLRSGITLVDTPGIGENKELGDILMEYVERNDVFGFIFAIKCDDSGGVLSRFREMLRQLAMIKDAHGQYKFDPKSIIFVANFWDKVKKEDKATVREGIMETLRREPCLKGLDLEKQLFFVNSLFAWTTWQAGLVSEDYEKLIAAVDRLFPIGHKQKLRLAYMWLENLLLRVLHPVHTFLHKAAVSEEEVKAKVTELTGTLDKTRDMADEAHRLIKEKFVMLRDNLKEALLGFLNKESTKKEMSTWRMGEVPEVKKGDSWVIIEENIDAAINARISSVLQEWEVKDKHFTHTEIALLQSMKINYCKVLAELDIVERTMQNLTGEKQKERPEARFNELAEDEKEREFAVDVAHAVHEKAKIGGNIFLHRLLNNPASLFHVNNKQRKQKQEKNAERFKADRVKYMKQLSLQVLKYMLEPDQDFAILELIDDQLKTTANNLTMLHNDTIGLIASNRSLAEQLLKDTRPHNVLEKTFGPMAQRLELLLEQAVSFNYDNIHDYEFPAGSFRESPRQNSAAAASAVLGEIAHLKTSTHEIVTVKTMPRDKRRYLYFVAKNTRMMLSYRNPPDFLPKFLGVGSHLEEPVLVYEGELTPARPYLQSRRTKGRIGRKQFIQNTVRAFMTDVARGVEFLHLRKLVHMELSLDTVYVQGANATVKLCHLFESVEVDFPDTDSPTGSYVYMPPETFPRNGRQRYSAPGDVYALGLMYMEVWAQCDLFGDSGARCDVSSGSRGGGSGATPKQLPLLTFLQSNDPGPWLIRCMDVQDQELQMNFRRNLVEGCLRANPGQRSTIRAFITDVNRVQ